MAEQLSDRIKKARETAGLTREQFAVALGVSFATVVRYESARTRSIATARLIEIAKVTDQPLSFFLGTVAA